VHIVFHAFYERVRPELRFFGNSFLQWPRTIHRILTTNLIMSLERRIYVKRRIALSAVSQTVAGPAQEILRALDDVLVKSATPWDAANFNRQARPGTARRARSAFGIVRPGELRVLLLRSRLRKNKGLERASGAFIGTEC